MSTVLWVFGVWTVAGTATALALAAMIRQADQREVGAELSLATANGLAAPRR